RRQTLLRLGLFEPVEQGQRDAGPRAAQRVAERDRSAEAVDGVRVEAEVADACQRLRGEGFVGFDGGEDVDAPPGALEHLPGRGRRPDAYDLRGHTGVGAGADEGARVESELVRIVFGPEHEDGGPVSERGRVAGGDVPAVSV